MTSTLASDRRCPHLPTHHFATLTDGLWCVACDGSVTPEGTVIPRGHVAAPPVNRNYSARIERFLSQPISLRRRSAA
jgi:hypothetical protein